MIKQLASITMQKNELIVLWSGKSENEEEIKGTEIMKRRVTHRERIALIGDREANKKVFHMIVE